MPKRLNERVINDVMSGVGGKKSPGLKPGQRHSGSFSRGHDPRRHLEGPRPHAHKKHFKEKIRELEDGALSLLESCITDPGAPYRERRAAAELVLGYSQGSVVSRVLQADLGSQGLITDSMGIDDIAQRLRLIHAEKEPEVNTYEDE